MKSTSVFRSVLVAALAGAVTLGTMAPASARPYRHHYRNNGAAAGIFALGALGIGLAIANSHRHRYDYDDRYAYDGGPAFNGYEGRWRDRRYDQRGGYRGRGGAGLDQYGRGYRGPGRQYMPRNVPTVRSQGTQGGDH